MEQLSEYHRGYRARLHGMSRNDVDNGEQWLEGWDAADAEFEDACSDDVRGRAGLEF